MDDFDRHLAKTQKLIAFSILAKLATVAGLIGLAVFAIKAFTS